MTKDYIYQYWRILGCHVNGEPQFGNAIVVPKLLTQQPPLGIIRDKRVNFTSVICALDSCFFTLW